MALDLKDEIRSHLQVLRRATKEEIAADERASKHRKKERWWVVRCTCGVVKLMPTSYWRHGELKSCGCVLQQLRAAFGETTKLPKGQAAKNGWFSQNRRWAERRGKFWDLTFEQFIELASQPCRYCGIAASIEYGDEKYNGTFVCNGLDRVNNNLGYVAENCVPCCTTCNKAKNTMTLDEFRNWVKRIYDHLLNPQANKDFPDRATRFAVCSRLAGIAPPKKK